MASELGNHARNARREAALERVLNEIPTWPLERLTITDVNHAIGCGNGYLYQKSERKERVHAALEARRRELVLEMAGQKTSPQPSPSKGEGAGDPDEGLASALRQQLADLKAENQALKDRLRANAVSERPPEPTTADPAEVLAAKLPQLEARIATINDQIEDLERQREAVWAQKRGIEECLKLFEVA